MLEGAFQHKDSMGTTGNLRSGDVQWMNAGSGVVHSEMPADELRVRGGHMEGFQLWVNLPASHKMSRPAYQDTPSAVLPVVPVPGAAHAETAVKVIAGTFAGVSSPISTAPTPIGYLDVRVGPGDAVTQPIPDGDAGFVYVYRGSAALGSNAAVAKEGGWAEVAGEAGSFTIACAADAAEPARALLIYGRPLHEPIARYGPMVMNTHEELQQAFDDYQAGRLGKIDGAEERYAATEAARAAQKGSGTWNRDL
jgi:quercetin 2,3-dioxygenase